MRTDTAARLLGFGSELTGLERGIVHKKLTNPADAIKLVAMELGRIRKKYPQASTAQLLNAYNRGDELILNMGEVARRSGQYLALITLALEGDLDGLEFYFAAIVDNNN